MISESDLVMIILAFLIGYIDDVTGPQKYYYEDTIVEVNSKYQCPTYCGVNHHHSVWHEGMDGYGMFIDKSLLKKKYKEKKIKRKNKR